jgi:hypothetical protein
VCTPKSPRARFSAAQPPQAFRLAVLAVVVMIFPGCGGVEEAKLADYLEVLDYNKPLESLTEVQLGDYRVSSATGKQEDLQRNLERTWVKISCKLYVIVSPGNASRVTKAYQRHQGVFDDQIVQIFRSATIDELSDPRWSVIKSRLSDFARPILGEERIHQVVVNDFGWEPI